MSRDPVELAPGILLGGEALPVIAGPCVLEEPQQGLEIAQALKVGQDLGLAGLIECRQRFVQQQESGLHQQGATECHSLALAAGEFGRVTLQQMADPQQFDDMRTLGRGGRLG